MNKYLAKQSFVDNRLGKAKRGDPFTLTDACARPYLLADLIEKTNILIEPCYEIVCIASGPSLTNDDAELVRKWRDEKPLERQVIVTNTTYQLCPWADIVYAMDRAWWDRYIDDVKKNFQGKMFTLAKKCHDVEVAQIETYQNSGAGALALAAKIGAKKLIMLGYDCKYVDGKKHWHGDHPKGLGNAGSVKKWPAQFDHIAVKYAKLNIVNCTRSTALKCFPLLSLEQALNECD